jgi:SAM-dependent methyltransferase
VSAIRPRVSFEAVARLGELFDYTPAFVLRAVSRLGVADHLAGGERRVEELADLTGTRAPALERVLRVLVGVDVLAEPSPGTFALRPMGELLTNDHPFSMRGAFRLHPDVDVLADLEYSLRTGEPAFERLFGEAFWAHLAGRPDVLAEFAGTMRALTRLELVTVLRLYPWSTIHTIVDVGGNDGTFLAALLARCPTMRGVVFDLPSAVAAAPAVLAATGVAGRAEIAAGDAFDDALPQGADAYVIKRVLVEFNDDRAAAFVRAVRSAMRPDSRLLVLEPMLHPGDRVGPSLDVVMLLVGRGRVRTPAEFHKVLTRAGLTVTRTIPAGLVTIVEAAGA